MKIYRLISDLTDIPLLEVRTDGNRIEVIVDNSNGKIPSEIGNTLQSLEDYANKSSHLSLEEPEEPTAHLLRYVLENGDVAEVTTDGKTCMLNGKLLTRAEKAAFFDALTSGKAKVARKADIQNPIPISGPKKQKNTYNSAKNFDVNQIKKNIEIKKEKDKDKFQQALLGKLDLSNYSFDVPSEDIPFAQRLAQIIAGDKKNAE